MKPIEKAERYTLSKLVVQNLKQYIIEHKLAPGERLPAERELSQIMKVSRAILREALRSLESAGILDIRHGEGAFLSANSLSPLLEQLSFAASLSGGGRQELREIRYLLEAAAIEEGVRRGSAFPIEELERWHAAAAQPQQADESGSQAAEAEAQFHIAIVGTLGNESLGKLAELFIRQALPHSGVKADERAKQRVRYLQALRSSDSTAAKLALRELAGQSPEAIGR
ncbi:FadR/GntR family transcriptional regulator [Paenibacillus hodogayensis]|uniref:FadR/GntR family transcriptional regulator n=1 Tax=Paenibacillus hodogayensis TaxID=279208 RepID=A0ABV5VUM1_9BACL